MVIHDTPNIGTGNGTVDIHHHDIGAGPQENINRGNGNDLAIGIL
jgi:hypothetical protein